LKLIVGLGNPGDKYYYTRHNIGFRILDNFAELFKIKFTKGKGDWYESLVRVNNEEIILMKPMTFMNNSGIAMKEFLDNINYDENPERKLKIKDVLVVVDDFQIPIGSIRVRKRGSDGGHNGLSSIIYHFNSDEFPRMRVGIGNENPILKNEFIDFVLGNFTNKEELILNDLSRVYNECILSFVRNGLTFTMNSFNRSFLEPELKPEKDNTIKILKENSDK
jgi:PTH1 family peptidyl-tRNA hydrolase